MFDYEKQGLRSSPTFKQMLSLHNQLRPYIKKLLDVGLHGLDSEESAAVGGLLNKNYFLINNSDVF
jgi:hypothetical protein